MAHTTTRGARRRQAVRAAAPVAGLLLAGVLVWQGSNAAFTATTDNTANAWETGQVDLSNNGGGATYSVSTAGLFDEGPLAPGDSGSGCITVQSTSDVAGTLELYAANVTAVPLAGALQMTIDVAAVAGADNVGADCVGFPASSTAAYSGTLAGMPTTYATGVGGAAITGAPPERVAYRIGWELPAAATNSVAGQVVEADFVWEVQTS